MPDYDFRCRECEKTFTVTFARVNDVDDADPRCPACGAGSPRRLIRRVAILTDEDTRMERLLDPARLAGVDENDPHEMGRLMREMAGELGEDAGPEMTDAIERLESGDESDL